MIQDAFLWREVGFVLLLFPFCFVWFGDTSFLLLVFLGIGPMKRVVFVS